MRASTPSFLAHLTSYICYVVLALVALSCPLAARAMSADEALLAASMSAMPSPAALTSPAHSAHLLSLLAPPNAPLTPGRLNPFNFTRPEGVRLFWLYVPSAYDSGRAWPLFYYFHGLNGDWQQGAQLNMTADAERAGYLLILGQGTIGAMGARGWNAGVCCLFNASTIVDDVAFARTALKLVQAAANIDTARVYTTGWSNGGFMSERLACEAPELFAGVAADASAVGLLPGGEAGLRACDAAFGNATLNYLHFHGTADTVVTWTGRTTNGPYPSALEDIARWNSRLGCGAELAQTYNDGTFSNLVWPRCRGGREVDFMSVRNGQHWWWTTQEGNFNTTGYALQFFTRTYMQQHNKQPTPTPTTTTPPAPMAARDPPKPPTKGAVATGVYRNVFAEAGYAQADIDKRLSSIVAQLTQGNPNTQTIVYPAQDPAVNGSYVLDVNNNDVRTEGMSYGLMWAVQLNNQTLFDRIWTWYATYMLHPLGDPESGYARWHCRQNGQPIDQGPAPDGETWAITALIFAARRWGDGGRINYTTQANFILTSLINKEGPNCDGHTAQCHGVQNIFGGADDSGPAMVRFGPGATFTDGSYHLPSFYEQWLYSSGGLQNFTYWRRVVNTSRAFFHAVTNPVTGLNPNYAEFDGTPNRGAPTFSFDAWRTARNIALDVAWYAADYAWQVGFCNRILHFFRGQPNWPQYYSQYTLNGTATDRGHATGLVAMNAVCALASNETVAWDFVDQLWNTPTPTGGGRYYDGALYLEAWLHLSGNFRADWSADVAPPPPADGPVNGAAAAAAE